MSTITYLKAINGAIAEAMRGDERVFVLGEDVAEGGPYGTTGGLAEEFGVERVLNTPISEGASASARRPPGRSTRRVSASAVPGSAISM